jgi:hypothetical protein
VWIIEPTLVTTQKSGEERENKGSERRESEKEIQT